MRNLLVGIGAVLALAVTCAQQQPSELAGRWEVQQIAGASTVVGDREPFRHS
ncbi:MAG: hypothetical protein IPL62_18370 [Caulobacteraceae bacterium]|nr:hypothetical protein [Caulobacteraceae bacterium]